MGSTPTLFRQYREAASDPDVRFSVEAPHMSDARVLARLSRRIWSKRFQETSRSGGMPGEERNNKTRDPVVLFVQREMNGAPMLRWRLW